MLDSAKSVPVNLEIVRASARSIRWLDSTVIFSLVLFDREEPNLGKVRTVDEAGLLTMDRPLDTSANPTVQLVPIIQ